MVSVDNVETLAARSHCGNIEIAEIVLGHLFVYQLRLYAVS